MSRKSFIKDLVAAERARITIAEACGWKGPFVINMDPCSEWEEHPFGNNPEGCWIRVPDYLNDLNACAEMEERLNGAVQFSEYAQHLFEAVCGSKVRHIKRFNPESAFVIARASAPERCEAFLRTLNLWKE